MLKEPRSLLNWKNPCSRPSSLPNIIPPADVPAGWPRGRFAPVPVLMLTLVLLMLVPLPMPVPVQCVEPALVPMRELLLLSVQDFFACGCIVAGDRILHLGIGASYAGVCHRASD